MPSRMEMSKLRIASESGSPVNEYRVNRGQVEFRSIDSEGRPFSYNGGSWMMLDANDLELHFALNTPVAQWLMHRLAKARGIEYAPKTPPLDST